MPAQTRFDAPKSSPDRVTWSGWKLVDSLEDWRTDAPESLPRCCLCSAVIEVGDPYAIRLPFHIACPPCVGLRAPTRPSRALRPIGLLDRGFARSSA
jgi:hypothetical protein